MNRFDSSECGTPGCNDEGYRIEERDNGGGGERVIEPKPPITTIDDTQCPENTASDLTSN